MHIASDDAVDYVNTSVTPLSTLLSTQMIGLAWRRWQASEHQMKSVPSTFVVFTRMYGVSYCKPSGDCRKARFVHAIGPSFIAWLGLWACDKDVCAFTNQENVVSRVSNINRLHRGCRIML